MTTYNGHRSWAYWNVSLWINNDEGLYDMARSYVRRRDATRDFAARNMLLDLKDMGITETPDGAAYSVDKIKAAMRGM